jgi:hypothetical protein
MQRAVKLAVFGLLAFFAVLLAVLYLTGFFQAPVKVVNAESDESAIPDTLFQVMKKEVTIKDGGFSEQEISVPLAAYAEITIVNEDAIAHRVAWLGKNLAEVKKDPPEEYTVVSIFLINPKEKSSPVKIVNYFGTQGAGWQLPGEEHILSCTTCLSEAAQLKIIIEEKK